MRPSRLSRPSRLVLTTLGLSLISTSPGLAQFPPLTVPKGLFRGEISGGFHTADRRFRAGESENLAADFVRAGLGVNFFPDLEPADELLRQLTGATGPQLDLGTSFATHQVTTGTFGLGLAYGLTSNITLFGYLPIVRVKTRHTLGLEEGSGLAGFNPADPIFGTAAGIAQAELFFSQFDAALLTLQSKLAAGDYNADPSLRALAEATLANGSSARDALRALTTGAGTASPFLPLRTSTSGAAIQSRIEGIQSALSTSLDVAGFSTAPVLAEGQLSNEDFARFLSDGGGPVAGSIETPSLSALGDAEVGLAVTLIDRLRPDRGGRGLRIAAQGLARLPTATLPEPRLFFDTGTGDKQTDVEGSVVTDLVYGRFGLRLLGGYSLQLAGTQSRRVATPDQPIPFASRLAMVSRDPGDLLTVGATPMVRLAETFALTGGAVWRRKGTDAVTYAAGQEPLPGIDAGLTALETNGSWTTATLGASFSVPGRTANGRTTRPLDAGLQWESVVQSAGPLRVPRTWGVRFWLRLYTGL
jgi:hypothetical protein